MSATVHVRAPGALYNVEIGPGALDEIGPMIRDLTPAESVALVTDETVASLFGMKVDTALAREGFRVLSLTVPAGEQSKSWAVAGDLCETLAAGGVSRTDAVVALGGGVVGDLAGFAAAVYLRGIDFIQVPTTLLAMVDSSVGGKTGVDLRAGKNLAGAFKQPLGVIADTAALATLPEDEWLSGLAEVAKTAVLDGEEFMSWLEARAEQVAARDEAVVTELVERCVRFKADVVARDEKEEGPRECLNYGHTLGHAIEKVLGYGAVTHGQAVAEGMRFASRVSVQVGAASTEFVRRQDRLLDVLGLTSIEERVEPSAVLEAMHVDKKSRSGVVRMVLVDSPSSWHCVPVQDVTISAHLDAWASTKGGE